MIQNIFRLNELIEKDELLSKLIHFHQGPWIQFEKQKWPLLSFQIGSQKPDDPVFFLIGGVHGLEKIGAELCWTFLKTTVDRLLWDASLHEILKKIRIVFVPLLNPYGYYTHHRSNQNGVDLMRNSPIDAVEKTPYLLGGHRVSNKIPWYRGALGQEPEVEIQFLMNEFEKYCAQSRCVVSIDFHSGFGMKDRLWFPYSYKREPFENLGELTALVSLFETTYPYHIYKIEPQSEGYLLNGDVWDHLYIRFKSIQPESVFLPFTLEMGSWTWVRKNPLQLFSRHGAFNPMKEHRQKRTYRRHHLLFDFILRALFSFENWAVLDNTQKLKFTQRAQDLWYS